MAEYISREAVNNLIEDMQNNRLLLVCERTNLYILKSKVAELPAADVQPVKQWISCQDKMPDTPEQGMDAKYSDCCLVCDDFGWIGMGYYLTDGKKSWWEFADAQNKNKIDWTEITHWMSLPEPPKESGTE